jgi:hypothetical protein
MEQEIGREEAAAEADAEWRASAGRSHKRAALAWLVFLACCGLLLGVALA